MTAQPNANAHPRVDGSATIYRLYDIGYTISLERAATLLASPGAERAGPTRGEARALQISNPPLLVPLGARTIDIAGTPTDVQVSARLFDFGVCSLQLRATAPAALAWQDFSTWGAQVGAAAAAQALMSAELRALVDRIAPATERPRVADVTEEYIVFRVDRVHGHGDGASVAELFPNEILAPLLLGETRPLSAEARRELLPHRFSYYDDDLAVLTWDNALVVEPRAEDRDVEYVLEFANAQLLELRMYDAHLDAELPALYERIARARARRRARYFGRLGGVLSDLQTRLADITETVERVENSLKVTDDVYLARVYAAALAIFREATWRRGVERKLGILRETYSMLNGEAQANRAEFLEAAIVLLIVFEIVIGFIGS
jgi:hypothetical protein